MLHLIKIKKGGRKQYERCCFAAKEDKEKKAKLYKSIQKKFTAYNNGFAGTYCDAFISIFAHGWFDFSFQTI